MKSIVQENAERCFICGRRATQTHHVFGGSNRKLADEDGLTVRLCQYCHDMVHFDPELSYPMQRALHERGQEAYEAAGHTREEFMKRYGRNYL